jgi:hypothetical protein
MGEVKARAVRAAHTGRDRRGVEQIRDGWEVPRVVLGRGCGFVVAVSCYCTRAHASTTFVLEIRPLHCMIRPVIHEPSRHVFTHSPLSCTNACFGNG